MPGFEPWPGFRFRFDAAYEATQRSFPISASASPFDSMPEPPHAHAILAEAAIVYHYGT